MIYQTKLVNMKQLELELRHAGLVVDNGIGSWGTFIASFDKNGDPVEIDAKYQPVVDAHVAMRQKTTDEYATEYRTAAPPRQSEIQGITAGLLPPEFVEDTTPWPPAPRLPAV